MIKIETAIKETLSDLDKPNVPGELNGLTTGLASLDKSLDGLKAGQLILIGGRPGMGKSALALNISKAAAKTTTEAVAYFSYEMLYGEISLKLLSSESRVELRKLKLKKFENFETNAISKAVKLISSLSFYIEDSSTLNMMGIRQKCIDLKSDRGLGLVVIDYLQLMPTNPKLHTRQFAMNQLLIEAKELAQELKVPVILLAQLTRSSTEEDLRPKISDLRAGEELEIPADVILLIHREDYYEASTHKKGIAELILARNRQAHPGTVEVKWDGATQSFFELI